MNKRQRKKRLKQQTNSIQLNNENTKIPEEMKDCVEADENTTKAKQASSVDGSDCFFERGWKKTS